MGAGFLLAGLGLTGAVLLTAIEGDRRQSRTVRPRAVEVGSLLRAVSDPALLVDRNAQIIELNEAAEKLVGHCRTELLLSPADRLLADAGNDVQDTFRSALTRALKGEMVCAERQVLQTKSGDTLLVSLAVAPVCDTAGQIAGALLALKDLSEVAHLQSAIEHSERHLAIGEMTAGLVHDFSNLLNTISEAVGILQLDNRGSQRDQTLLEIIDNAVRRGCETISNVRKYMVGKGGEPSPVDVRQLLDEVLELTNPVLNSHPGIVVVRETQACGTVRAIPDELRRAFTNLVLNALDAMPQKGTLTVSCRESGGRIVVSVRDTGVGIPLESQPKIFSAYFTTKKKGTGLGLAGARRAIEAQGGEIRFESLAGRGTTFYVSLPRIQSAEGQAACLAGSERRVS